MWDAPWVVVGRTSADETRLAVWWRGTGSPEVTFEVPAGAVDVVYPTRPLGGLEVAGESGRLRLRATSDKSAARLLRIRHQDGR